MTREEKEAAERESINKVILPHAQAIKKDFPFGELTILLNGYHGEGCDHNVLLTEDTPEKIRYAIDRLQEEMDDFRGEMN